MEAYRGLRLTLLLRTSSSSRRPWPSPASPPCSTSSRPLSTTSIALKRANTRRPSHPTMDRLQMIAVSEPIHSHPHPDTQFLWRDCPRHDELAERRDKAQPNDFERLFVAELRGLMEESRMVAFFHMNCLMFHPARKAWQDARRVNMELKSYNDRIARACFEGTRWQPLLHFWKTMASPRIQHVVFSREVAADKLLKLDRKIPDLLLMGALIDNRVLNKKQLQEMATMPGLDIQRGELCSILQAPVRKTMSMLSSNQTSLSRNLEQYVKDQSQSAVAREK